MRKPPTHVVLSVHAWLATEGPRSVLAALADTAAELAARDESRWQLWVAISDLFNSMSAGAALAEMQHGETFRQVH